MIPCSRCGSAATFFPLSMRRRRGPAPPVAPGGVGRARRPGRWGSSAQRAAGHAQIQRRPAACSVSQHHCVPSHLIQPVPVSLTDTPCHCHSQSSDTPTQAVICIALRKSHVQLVTGTQIGIELETIPEVNTVTFAGSQGFFTKKELGKLASMSEVSGD